MKIRYIIENTIDHYVEYHINLIAKTLSNIYVKNGVVQTGNSISIAEVLAVEPTLHPRVEIAKRNQIWDFHFFKVDGYGIETRKTLGLHLAEDVGSTKVVLLNDTTEDVVLKNYTTHELDVYNSSLVLSDFDFSDLLRVSGHSGNGATNAELTAEGELKLGWDADLSLQLSDEGIPLTEQPLAFYLHIKEFGPNGASTYPQIEWTIGSNLLTFDLTAGVTFNGVAVSGVPVLHQDLHLKLELDKTTAHLFIDGQKSELSGFDLMTPISVVGFRGGCDNGAYSLISKMTLYSRENYRLDTAPPNMVMDVDIITGDQEVILSWDPNTENDLAGYHVYVNGYRHNLSIIPVSNYQVTGLTNGQSVRIVVTAIDKSGNESVPTKPVDVSTIADPSKEVSNMVFNDRAEGTFFEWVNPTYTDFDKIMIYRTLIADGSSVELGQFDIATTSFLDDTNPPAGNYIYTFYTQDVYGNTSGGLNVYKAVYVWEEPVVEEPVEPKQVLISTFDWSFKSKGASILKEYTVENMLTGESITINGFEEADVDTLYTVQGIATKDLTDTDWEMIIYTSNAYPDGKLRIPGNNNDALTLKPNYTAFGGSGAIDITFGQLAEEQSAVIEYGSESYVRLHLKKIGKDLHIESRDKDGQPYDNGTAVITNFFRYASFPLNNLDWAPEGQSMIMGGFEVTELTT